MSHIAVTDVVLDYISREGRCIYCRSRLKICPVCKDWYSGRGDKESCGGKCRTTKCRQKIREDLELDDE
jgi:hypothetical protein